ncbi:MAG: tetratricopeptide repeat protein [Acidobacteriia bacterium]|nr:tetratricopeptide repeat protein [Terriglobia bacterium]
MEKDFDSSGIQPEVAAPTNSQQPDGLELAHVLYMDLVAFSTWPMEEQRQGLQELQKIVRNTSQMRAGEGDSNLIRLPTGDGMALVFFGDPVPCVECALEISAGLKNSPLKLRMGIHTGPVYRVADINTNLNVAGGGINMAQRIMDGGDAGHILVSKSTADILVQLRDWAPHLHDLGEHSVKHGVKLQFFNLYTAELGNSATPSRFQAEHKQSAKRQKQRIVVAAVAALLIALLGLAVASRMLPEKRRRSVAVMGFRNITSRQEAAWVSTSVAEGLRTQLASTGKVRTISGQECAEIWHDLGLTELNSMSEGTLSRIHQRGADIVIVGSYTDLAGGRIHLNLEIQDTRAGETVDSLVADGTETEITQLIAQTGERLRTKMGLGTISSEKERQLALSQPSPEAAPFYSEGLAKLRTYDPLPARSFLEKAVIVDPAFPFAHSALGEAWLVLGYDQKARDEAKKAFELSTNLSFEDRTSIEGRYRSIVADWPAAMMAYQQLYKYSQNLDYGLKLAEVQRSAGKGQDALATLTSLRKLPAPEGADPRIDLEEAETAASLGDVKRGLTVAANAAATAKATGARLLESRALVWNCVAFRRLGEMENGKRACEQARKIATGLEDKLGEARALNNLANISRARGDLDAAKRLFEQALALGQNIGAQRDVAGALNNIANILATQGELAEANLRYEEALKIEQEIAFKSEIPRTLGNQGVLLHQQGDLRGAQQAFELAITAARDIGSRNSLAGSTMNLGVVLFERGDLQAAEDSYQKALAIQKTLGAKSQMATTLDSLGDLQVARANLSEAEQSYREAMAIQQELGDKGSVAMSQTGLANVLLEKSQASQAESTVRAAIAELHAEKDAEGETAARLVLARALLAQKNLAEADKEISTARALSAGASSRTQQYDVAILSARARAAAGTGTLTKALESLQAVVREAKSTGMPGSELEARLALGELELARGDRARAQAELSAVQKQASDKGYLLIAKKAVPEIRSPRASQP